MSYDCSLCDPVSGEVLELDEAHDMRGGTYCHGGTRQAWLNITYNYCRHYYGTIDAERGLRSLQGKTGAESIPILKAAIDKLGNDVDPDYWKATEGNAKRALAQLLSLAQLRPDGIWNVG